ncbi:MAG: hypothetical protein WC364_05655 [Eubacteriales bacterium]|jgi:hypothetical protein
MEQIDRDLLIRIDERIKAIKDRDNGDIPDILRRLIHGDSRMENLENVVKENCEDIKWIKKIGSAIIGSVITVVIALSIAYYS